MILIFGGAFQGKLDYARKHWNFNEDDIFYCDDSLTIDLSKKVIYGLEKFCFACVCEDADAKGVLKMYDEPLTDKIIIMDDVSHRHRSQNMARRCRQNDALARQGS